jgi:DMSO reductase family type II enzyme chaperone
MELESRALLYAALAHGFDYPDELAEADSLAAMTQAIHALEDATLHAALQRVREAASAPAASPTPAEEHTFLFARQTPCPPYEASYTRGAIAYQLADIAGFYRAFGLQVAGKSGERADHICSELEFMAALCAKEALARSRGLHEQAEICRDARRAFLVEHLGRWAGQFARRIAEHARLPYYTALADLLVALLNHEAVELNVVLEEQPVTQAPEAVDFDALECAGLR